MMSSLRILQSVIIPTIRLMPARYRSVDAARLILAIGIVESDYTCRRQHPAGQARGWWRATRLDCLEALRVDTDPIMTAGLPTTCADLHEAVEWSEIGACMVARLMLYDLPDKLPTDMQRDAGRDQYLAAWKREDIAPAAWLGAWSSADLAIDRMIDDGLNTWLLA